MAQPGKHHAENEKPGTKSTQKTLWTRDPRTGKANPETGERLPRGAEAGAACTGTPGHILE